MSGQVDLKQVRGGIGKGISRSLDPASAQYVLAMFQKDAPVGDDELNLVQQIAQVMLTRSLEGILTDGLAAGGLDFTGGSGVLNLLPSLIFFNSFPVSVANPDGTGAKVAVNLPSVASLSGSQTRSDLVWLEFWFEEVGPAGVLANGASSSVFKLGGMGNSTLTNVILNPTLNEELTRRVQLRWRVRTESSRTTIGNSPNNTNGLVAQGGNASEPDDLDTTTYVPSSLRRFVEIDSSSKLHRAGDPTSQAMSQALGAVDGYVWALPVAVVSRRAGQTTIASGDIASSMPRAQLKLQVPRSTIYPPLPDPLPGELNLPQRLIYEGVAVDSLTGQGSDTQTLATQSLAVKFTVTAAPEFVQVGNTIQVSRAALRLKTDSGSALGRDITVELRANASVTLNSVTYDVPANTVLASFVLPGRWLTDAARWISVPLDVAVAQGAKVWLVVRSAGDAAVDPLWECEAATPPDANHTPRYSVASNPTTVDWQTGSVINVAPPLHAALYTGYAGAVVHALEGSTPVVSFVEYDSDGNVTYTGSKDASGARLAHFSYQGGVIARLDEVV